MDKQQLLALLEAYRKGDVPAEAVLTQWQKQPLKELSYAKIDMHWDGAPQALRDRFRGYAADDRHVHRLWHGQ